MCSGRETRCSRSRSPAEARARRAGPARATLRCAAPSSAAGGCSMRNPSPVKHFAGGTRLDDRATTAARRHRCQENPLWATHVSLSCRSRYSGVALLPSSLLAQKDDAGGPFGLRMGMSAAELRKVVDLKVVEPEQRPLVLQTERLPRHHDAFEGYLLIVSEKVGLCKIVGLGETIAVKPEGKELRSAFEDLEKAIERKYGRHLTRDELEAGQQAERQETVDGRRCTARSARSPHSGTPRSGLRWPTTLRRSCWTRGRCRKRKATSGCTTPSRTGGGAKKRVNRPAERPAPTRSSRRRIPPGLVRVGQPSFRTRPQCPTWLNVRRFTLH